MSTQIGSFNSGGDFQQERHSYQTNERKTVEYVLSSSDEGTFLGGYNIGTSTSDGLILASIETRAQKGVTKATLVYITEEEMISGGFGGTGTAKSADANAIEFPIETHWAYSGGLSEVGGVANVNGNDKPGVTSFLAPSPVYTYTQVVSSFTFSESNIVDGVGQLSSPTGMSGATTDYWLKVGKRISPQGDKFVIEEVWQYRIGGWDTDIYS